MARTPEGVIKDKVKKVLAKYGAYWHMVVQNGLGAPSLDFVVCHAGRFCGIETKPGNKPMSPRQEITSQNMRKAGAFVLLINDVEGLDTLEQWLQEGSDDETQLAA